MVEIEDIAKIPATGDEVQRRYRYQYLYTILIAIQMYQKTISYEKLFCELAEDVLAVLPNKKFIGIQIKTAERKGAVFSFNDDAVVNSLKRFVELDKKFPNEFESFVFVSNVDFKKGKDLQDILNAIKDGKELEKEYEEFIQKLTKKCRADRAGIINTLCKTSCQKGPSIDDIESKIIHEHLSKISHCSGLTVPQLESILKQFVQIVFDKSSKSVKNSISQYVAFVKNGKKKQLKQELESKEITHEQIERISKNVDSIYLKSTNPTSLTLKAGSIELMKKKMAVGEIHDLEINSMKDLSYSAQVYFFEEYNKRNGQSEEVKKQIDQLQTLLTNEAAEARSETQQNDKAYGVEMLKSIEKRLKNIVMNRHQDVFYIKYEILKGIIGVLTSDCRVWFSNHTKEELN